MRYFHKEIADTPLYLPKGVRIPFNRLSDGNGIWASDNPDVLAEMDKAIAKHIGGLSEITAAQHAELLKKKTGQVSRTALLQDQQFNPPQPLSPFQRGLGNQPFNPPVERVAAVAAGVPQVRDTTEKPEPLRVPQPSEFRKPRTARVGSIKGTPSV